jgi:predicted Zn-dependent protease
MIKNLTAYLIITLFYLQNIHADIIRDSEIDETIDLVVAPLKKVAGLNDLKIYLIDDQTPNAFTVGGQIIFVHSGLIIKFPDPDVLRGVIAHEIGHILGQHIIRRQEIVSNYTMAAMGTAALGLVTAVSAGAPGIAVMLAGTHVADRQVQAYSRTFESSADQAALKLLEKSHHSDIGMIKFFEKTKMDSQSDLINPYEQSHPLSHQRLVVLKNENKKSKYSKSQNTPDLIYKFNRISTKLAAYTLDLGNLPACDYQQNVDEYARYTKAIKCFRVGNFNKALDNVNSLLETHPQDPFYHELKGQILFEAGSEAALEEYNIAASSRQKDPLILLGKAIVGITQYKNNPAKLDEFYQDLLFVIHKEPDNLLALYYMAFYYEKKGLQGKSYLNSAIIAHKLGREKDALQLATKAIKEFKKNTPDWYKANDIIAANK